MGIAIKILGSSSATPQYNRHHSSQYVQIGKSHLLIDCGEATQLQLKRYGVKITKLDTIFISHLHGDHFFGLIGLLSSMHLSGRTEDLHIYGPNGLQEILLIQFKYSDTILKFQIHFHLTNPEGFNFVTETDEFTVHSFPLKHRIACTGFLFKEKPKNHRINKGLLPENMLLQHIALLKKGNDVFDSEGNILYSKSELTSPPRKSFSYAYCSDTIYDPSICQYFEGVDCLYHEATFLHDMLDRAQNTFHTTALQAAQIALQAKVGTLLLGHFSARYKELDAHLIEAKTVFEKSSLAQEGLTFLFDE